MKQHHKYWSFRRARKFARKLKLKGQAEWRLWCMGMFPDKPKKPDGIPTGPDVPYKGKGWKGYPDWLGYEAPAINFASGSKRSHFLAKNKMPFEKAREFVHGLNLKNVQSWWAYCRGILPGHKKKPAEIPVNPSLAYANDGWKNWPNWLGNGRFSTKTGTLEKPVYLPFEAAREYVRALGIPRVERWEAYAVGRTRIFGRKLPTIPDRPDLSYAASGWAGWEDFLGLPAPKLKKVEPKTPAKPAEKAKPVKAPKQAAKKAVAAKKPAAKKKAPAKPIKPAAKKTVKPKAAKNAAPKAITKLQPKKSKKIAPKTVANSQPKKPKTVPRKVVVKSQPKKSKKAAKKTKR